MTNFICNHCKYVMRDADPSDVKLLTTTVSKSKDNPELKWTISTCPSCKTTFVIDPKALEVIRMAPKTHISAPKYEMGK